MARNTPTIQPSPALRNNNPSPSVPSSPKPNYNSKVESPSVGKIDERGQGQIIKQAPQVIVTKPYEGSGSQAVFSGRYDKYNNPIYVPQRDLVKQQPLPSASTTVKTTSGQTVTLARSPYAAGMTRDGRGNIINQDREKIDIKIPEQKYTVSAPEKPFEQTIAERRTARELSERATKATVSPWMADDGTQSFVDERGQPRINPALSEEFTAPYRKEPMTREQVLREGIRQARARGLPTTTKLESPINTFSSRIAEQGLIAQRGRDYTAAQASETKAAKQLESLQAKEKVLNDTKVNVYDQTSVDNYNKKVNEYNAEKEELDKTNAEIGAFTSRYRRFDATQVKKYEQQTAQIDTVEKLRTKLQSTKDYDIDYENNLRNYEKAQRQLNYDFGVKEEKRGKISNFMERVARNNREWSQEFAASRYGASYRKGVDLVTTPFRRAQEDEQKKLLNMQKELLEINRRQELTNDQSQDYTFKDGLFKESRARELQRKIEKKKVYLQQGEELFETVKYRPIKLAQSAAVGAAFAVMPVLGGAAAGGLVMATGSKLAGKIARGVGKRVLVAGATVYAADIGSKVTKASTLLGAQPSRPEAQKAVVEGLADFAAFSVGAGAVSGAKTVFRLPGSRSEMIMNRAQRELAENPINYRVVKAPEGVESPFIVKAQSKGGVSKQSTISDVTFTSTNIKIAGTPYGVTYVQPKAGDIKVRVSRLGKRRQIIGEFKVKPEGRTAQEKLVSSILEKANKELEERQIQTELVSKKPSKKASIETDFAKVLNQKYGAEAQFQASMGKIAEMRYVESPEYYTIRGKAENTRLTTTRTGYTRLKQNVDGYTVVRNVSKRGIVTTTVKKGKKIVSINKSYTLPDIIGTKEPTLIATEKAEASGFNQASIGQSSIFMTSTTPKAVSGRAKEPFVAFVQKVDVMQKSEVAVPGRKRVFGKQTYGEVERIDTIPVPGFVKVRKQLPLNASMEYFKQGTVNKKVRRKQIMPLGREELYNQIFPSRLKFVPGEPKKKQSVIKYTSTGEVKVKDQPQIFTEVRSRVVGQGIISFRDAPQPERMRQLRSLVEGVKGQKEQQVKTERPRQESVREDSNGSGLVQIQQQKMATRQVTRAEVKPVTIKMPELRIGTKTELKSQSKVRFKQAASIFSNPFKAVSTTTNQVALGNISKVGISNIFKTNLKDISKVNLMQRQIPKQVQVTRQESKIGQSFIGGLDYSSRQPPIGFTPFNPVFIPGQVPRIRTPPGVPGGFSFGGGGSGGYTGDKGKSYGRQKKGYTPDFTSVLFGIKAKKRPKASEITGIGLRPILTR